MRPTLAPASARRTRFSSSLWARFEAQEKGTEALKAERESFARELHKKAQSIFGASLPAIPCASVFRPRAEARATRAFDYALRKFFPELFQQSNAEETENAAA
jgi:CRISPR system Cascade subunit CasA